MEALVFTSEQRAAYRQFAANATDEQYNLFITECERRRLIPGVHVVFQLRKAREFSLQLSRNIDVEKVTLITTINALRLIAERTGKFNGYGKFTYYYGDADGNPTVQSNIPYGRPPHAVSVELFRQGWQQPVFAVARYEAYVQTKRDGDKEVPTKMWRIRGEEQLAKCAEAAGLRMVAPEECGGLYIAEEFERETKEQDATTAQENTTPVAVPTSTVAPPVNQAAAEIHIQTSPFREVAEASTKPATPAAPAPKPAAAPAPKPAAPKPATPRPAAPPATKAPVAPATPPAPATTNPVHNRVPQPVQEIKESPAELVELADRIDRDKTPAKFVATDADLPEVLQPKQSEQMHISEQPAPAAPQVASGDAPATNAEYQDFVTKRATKVVRDKLEKQAGMKNAGAEVKNYLLRASGKDKLTKISAATFERLISALETATPEQAVQIVKG
jgi:hypothetical protein